MLSVDSKVIGIAIEHRNPINQSADFVVWKEGKTRVYRNGEISRGSAVLEGTIHVIQGLYVNCGRTCIFLLEYVKGRYAQQLKEERQKKCKEVHRKIGAMRTLEGIRGLTP